MRIIIFFCLIIYSYDFSICMDLHNSRDFSATKNADLASISTDNQYTGAVLALSAPIVIYACYLESRKHRLLVKVKNELHIDDMEEARLKADLHILLPLIRDAGVGISLAYFFGFFAGDNEKIKILPSIISTTKSLTKWHEKIIKQEARYGANNSILNDMKSVFTFCFSKVQSMVSFFSPSRIWRRWFDRRTTPPIAFL